ncbi:MAG: hypothetical protein M1839_007008 [Geoglossum umbratile]|nr:MAG: hypothetical protein M1839_007008 [Geoglossum umbratile]
MDEYEKIVVGVDLGLTCTGVAWSKLATGKPLAIQQWPGRDQVVNKVRTAVTYRAGGVRIHSWGSECPPPQDLRRGMDVKEYFKLFLDESVLTKAFEDRPDECPGIEEVRLWFHDYLRQVYSHITRHLQETLNCTEDEWNLRQVEYMFSVPTAWAEHSVVEDYRKITRNAGFGEGDKHSVKISLTESEASAVYSAHDQKHEFQIGDILLVCDAGGGTTDTSVMEVMPAEDGSARLEQISVVEGVTFGSVQIDDAFILKVERRLKPVRNDFPRLPDYVAHQMVKAGFQDIKREFGQRETMLLGIFAFEVPGLPSDYNNEDVGIEFGKMEFSRDEIKELFDEQISGIFQHIDPQLELLYQGEGHDGRPKKVSCFVLSGGLGSSAYVQDRFRARYGNGGKTKILVSKDPQLAVCKGLVIDRIQHLRCGTGVLQTRRCRASYGILFNEPYDKRKHRGQKPLKGPLDGKEYVIDQIDWFIVRGEPITDGQSIVRRYSRIADTDNPDKVWKVRIAICRRALPPENLPQRLPRDPAIARVVCEIKSDLQSHAFGEDTNGVAIRFKHWWRFGKKYLKIDHEVVINIGPADLSFEMRFDNKTWNDKKVVPVEWMPEQDPMTPEEPMEDSGWHNGLVRLS